MEAIRFLAWGEPGQAHVEGDAVPADQVWKIRAAGIATDDGANREWMLQIRLPDPWQWLVPLERLNGTAAGTPVLALTREVWLCPGERLAARCNSLGADKKMALIYVGWSFPLSEHESLVRGGSGVASATLPDLSALASAVQATASALQGLST